MKKENESIMFLYKSYLVDRKKKSFSFDEDALKKGILIDKDAGKEIIDLAVNTWGIDGYLLNQTFHKSLNTVINSSDEELLLKQLIHYFSTYGFKSLGIYDKDTVYIPKEKLDIPELKQNIRLTFIKPIKEEELKENIWSLLTSSIALSNKTIDNIIPLTNHLKIDDNKIEEITNREVRITLYSKLNMIPKNNVEFLRFLIYTLTNKTLLIKDFETSNLLRFSDKSKALKLIKSYEKKYSLDPLSEIFNRFKPLFLSLKTSKIIIEKGFKRISKDYNPTKEELELNKIINKISKLSKKNHKPFIQNDLDNIAVWYRNNCNKKDSIRLFKNLIKNESVWRIIKLRNYMNIINKNIDERVYKIRNGKTWITSNSQDIKFNKEYIDILDSIIINKLKSNVTGKKVFLDENIDIALPQSEKQFCGNIPFSSSIDIKKDNLLVGIHWFNVNDKSVDLDLKVISNEYSIGWDSSYKEGDKLVFTGDITDAPLPNGASEYIYIDKTIDNTIFSLKVNNYTRNVDNVEYDIIIAKKSKDKLTSNCIVDPNDILVKIPKNIIEKDKCEHSLGVIVIDDNNIKLIFTDLTTSSRITSSNNVYEEILRNYLKDENSTKCKLKDYLKQSGAIITKDKNDIDIDLSINSIDKNNLLDLLK